MNKRDEIIILLHGLKKDVGAIKEDIAGLDGKISKTEIRINNVESILDRAKGMAIIIVSVFTVGFTLAYEYIKKLLGI